MRPATQRWISASLLGFLLLTGCNQAQRQPKTLYRPAATAEGSAPAAGTVIVTQLPDPPPTTTQVAEQQPPAPPATLPAAKTEAEMQPASYAVTTPKVDPSKNRRSFADISARPGFAHADNYGWVQGELQYLHSHQCWRVRYASVDEDDKYGGYVVLEEAGRMMGNLQSGQMVRVEGEVLEPSSSEMGSKSYRYRVRSIEPMSNP
jgi:hypothetical protein